MIRIRFWLVATILAWVLLKVGSVSAYDLDTHADLSRAATNASALSKDPSLLKDLGIKGTDEFPNSKENNKPKPIVELIRDGARFEDDNVRSLNHFYDPANNRALTFGFITAGFKSPDWALKALFTIDDDQQAFSLKDAHDYLYKALTATKEEDRNKYFGLTFQTLGQVIHHPQDMTQPQHTRNDDHCPKELPCKYPGGVVGAFNPSLYESWTNLYREQPFIAQYFAPGLYPKVRFDTARKYWHTEDKNPGQGQGIAEFTNSNFVSAGTNFRGAIQNGQQIALPNERYPLPVPGVNTPNYELVTAEFFKDTLDMDGKSVLVPDECKSPNPPCVIGFISSVVKDNLQPQKGDTNKRASAISIFDQDLKLNGKTVPYPNLDKCTDPKDLSTCEKINTNQIFTLNQFTFRNAHSFLLPRAVAYSAGLIDYFFRGRLEIQDAGYTDTGVGLRIKNAIDPDAEPVWKNETLTNGGELRVAFDYKTPDGKSMYGVSNAVTLTEDIKPGLASAGHYSFTFPENAIPEDAKEIRYRLVFRGRIGKEDGAVAVGAFKPMSGFVVAPNYVPTDGKPNENKKDEPRLIYRAHGKWKLSPEKGIQAGNVDWRGWYVNGNPTKLLTWVGARARYMPDRQVCMDYRTPNGNYQCRWASSSATSTEIYQGGEVFANAPGPVLGAAVTRDSQGKDWLVVITLDGPNLGEVVWRRPYEKGDSDALYDPTNAPKGWQEIGRFKGSDYSNNAANRINHTADIPWFFNGNGTRAQTMRRWWDTSNNGLQQSLDRLELSIVDDVTRATFTNHRNLTGILLKGECSSNYDADGAGSGALTASANGESLVAVDFKDNELLLAKAKIEAAGKESSTVTVTKDSGGSKTTSGSTTRSVLQKETFILQRADQTIVEKSLYTDNSGFKSTWTYGPGVSNYSHEFKPSVSVLEVGYYFDLRFGLFSYYEDSFADTRTLVISDGATARTGTGTSTESHRIDSLPAYWGNRALFSNSYSYTYTPGEPQTHELHCRPESNYTRTVPYYYNFPWFFENPVGGWAADLENRFLVSQFLFADSGYLEVGPYNAIIHKGGSSTQLLPEVIPGGSGKPKYYPVGVVR